ncbi:hypothetical protein B0H11DRAFT_1916809 [Mycena galericulata]|nr:hypothetical protein B0H11DRAFT_1916809 [Mycena galericulata]
MPPLSFQQYQAYQQFLADNPNLDAAPPVPPTPTPTFPPSNASTPAAPVLPVGQQERQREAAAPISQQYQSVRTPQLVPPLIAPSSFLPYLGMPTLAPSAPTLNTSHANQERLRHARSSGVGVARRTRGAAQEMPFALPGLLRVPTFKFNFEVMPAATGLWRKCNARGDYLHAR